MAAYLARYLAGEHEQGWHELVSMGDAVRDEPLFTDAQAVAREMMRRVDTASGRSSRRRPR